MKSPTEIAIPVSSNMPGIGFFSSAKRIHAFNVTCHMIEKLSQNEDGELDDTRAAEAAAILVQTNKRYQKGFLMTLLNFDRLSAGSMNMLAYKLL